MNSPRRAPRRVRRRRRSLHRQATRRERVVAALGTIVFTTVLGTLGFAWIEDVSILDALYLTVHTISTVGSYGHELSPLGRSFSVVLIMAGMTAVAFALFTINMWLMEGAILEVMGERRMGRELRTLRDHVIVCGAGRIGVLVAEDLREAHAEFVLIDHDGDRVKEMLAQDILAIEGNAADEDTLLRAGIERANTLVSVVRSDADNLYITMTARSLNPNITIVARAEDSGTVTKLKRVGADRVVAPYHLGALRIANAVLRPAVTDMIEMTQPHADNALGLQMAEVTVGAGSRLADKALRDTSVRQEIGIVVIAVRGPDGVTKVNPEPDQPLLVGSVLVAIGTEDQLDKFAEWAHP